MRDAADRRVSAAAHRIHEWAEVINSISRQETGMFHVGQRVVCVDGNAKRPMRRGEALPVEGRIYTIRAVNPGEFEGVRLVEIVNPPHNFLEGYDELAYDPSRFRPVQERKTDISFAHEILRKVTKRQPVKA